MSKAVISPTPAETAPDITCRQDQLQEQELTCAAGPAFLRNACCAISYMLIMLQ
jgi:hypothetical protein